MNKNINNKRFPLKELYIAALLLSGFVFIMITGNWGSESIENIQNGGSFFVFATLLSCVALTYQVYRKEILNRSIIAVTLFFLIGSVVFLINDPVVNMYYDEYAGLTMFLSLIVVGIISTFYSSAGLIGVEVDDKAALHRASVILLITTVFCMIFSMGARLCGAGLLFYSYVPVIIWIQTDFRLAKKLRRPDARGWSFKW